MTETVCEIQMVKTLPSAFWGAKENLLVTTLLHSEWLKLHRVLAGLSAKGLRFIENLREASPNKQDLPVSTLRFQSGQAS